MNQKEFQQAVKRFDANMKQYKVQFKPAENLRLDFLKRFPLSRIRKMKLDEYVQGKGVQEDNFCYEIEWKLGALGSIVGASAKKFGIYFSKKSNSYQINRIWKRTTDEQSMAALRMALVNLIEAGDSEDFDTIRKSAFSPMFTGKILATYFPEKYLSVFSEEHLDYFIHRLELDAQVDYDSDIFDKRNVLVDFKNRNAIMKRWSLHAFAHFLYTEYPKAPSEEDVNPDFIDNIEFMNGDFHSLESDFHPHHGKVDYEKQTKAKVALGERGEYIVMQYELQKLKRIKSAKRPKQVSVEDDSLGYDIQSYDEHGNKIFIEVKATNSSPKDFHFYFSANELESALDLAKDYHVYIVFNPNSSKPKIFDLGNPFIEEGKVSLIPIAYKLRLQKI